MAFLVCFFRGPLHACILVGSPLVLTRPRTTINRNAFLFAWAIAHGDLVRHSAHVRRQVCRRRATETAPRLEGNNGPKEYFWHYRFSVSGIFVFSSPRRSQPILARACHEPFAAENRPPHDHPGHFHRRVPSQRRFACGGTLREGRGTARPQCQTANSAGQCR